MIAPQPVSTYDENPFHASTYSSSSVSSSSSSQQMTNPMVAPIEPPAWLRDTKTPADLGDAPQESAPQAPALDPAVPRMILYSRVINLSLSICMIVASLLSLLTTDNATTGVLACYVVVFSCLLCCFETHLKQISKVIAMNFGFMYSAKSRSAFMMFVGTILFSFSLFGKIIGCLMLANACFNIFIIFKYPGYEDAQRQDAQSEIKDYLAANPAFAQQFATMGVAASTAFLANNPDAVRQGFEVLSQNQNQSGKVQPQPSSSTSFSV